MSLDKSVDPILYAWRHCNEGIALPLTLARSMPRAPVVRQLDDISEAARQATHSQIFRRRPRAAEPRN
jgi:hypothetical protein